MFACCGRGQGLYGESNVDSSAFSSAFPSSRGLCGFFCNGCPLSFALSFPLYYPTLYYPTLYYPTLYYPTLYYPTFSFPLYYPRLYYLTLSFPLSCPPSPTPPPTDPVPRAPGEAPRDSESRALRDRHGLRVT